MLSRQTAKFQQGAEDSRTGQPRDDEDASKGVWPRIEVTEGVKTDSKGRVRSDRRWYLVLENTTGRPVHNVTFEFEGVGEDQLFQVAGADDPIETMPPNGEYRLPLLLVMGSPNQVKCLVTWADHNGEHVTAATVRT